MLLDKQAKSATARAVCTIFPKGIPSGGARNYDSDLGIWYGVDPLADKYPGLSPYNYCLNNPVNSVDPDGIAVEKPLVKTDKGETL